MLAEARPPSRRARWVLRALVTVLVAGLAIAAWTGVRLLQAQWRTEGCTVQAGATTVTATPEQAANAAVITAVAMRRGLPNRAATIALATAMQESKLRNLRGGDRDSVGLFQQRPSQGWGTVAQILDPVYASNAFYDRLERVSDWENRPLTEAAQAVQRSAFPDAYAQHESAAAALTVALAGAQPAALGCELRPAAEPGSATRLGTALAAHHGLSAQAVGTGTEVTVATSGARAWAVAAWAVAQADALAIERVQVADRVWDRDSGGWSVGTAASVTDVRIGLAG